MHAITPTCGTPVPPIDLSASDGRQVRLSSLPGLVVVYAYPRTSPPGAAPIEGWDQIPGALGCTPQSCGYRDHFADLTSAGAAHVFGLSTQDSAFQAEVVTRLGLPFPLLSDADLRFARAIGLATFEAGGMILLKRATMILRDGILVHYMATVPNPAENAADVARVIAQLP